MTTELQLRLGEALSDRYTILREIGSGILAMVFLAEDRKHGRRVAVKVLRPNLAEGVATQRFHREIAIAARLQHPHILPLYDSGEANGLIYFTMPYVEGETLRDLIKKEKALAVVDSLRIARQVANALSYSHGRGIIHRDIKPANILISEGFAQVADFGIARAFAEAGGEALTGIGHAIGTPAYMSPEQWTGTGEVDERSDLYSLGCVLYEMLAGEPPFTGATTQVIMARHITQPVPSLRHARPTLPGQLEDILQKALSKLPADRYSRVSEFDAELAEVEADGRAASRSATATGAGSTAGPRAGQQRPGIVVLPFAQFWPPGDDDYIAFGLTDEIITSLSGLEGLRVIARTTAAQLKGADQDVRELGKKLNVGYVLEGSVRRAGETLRVATRLITADSETLVWGKSYEGLIPQLFELEKTISRAVVEALAVQVSTKERKRLNEHRISDIRAFEYYLRAKKEVYTFTEPALERALGYLKKAAEISGENVALWAAMGYVYWQYINAGISADPVYFQHARECADRILQIDSESPEARRLLGLIEIHAKGDPQVAVDHLKAALDADPNDPDALFWLALIYGMVGRSSSGMVLATRLLDIDPLTPLHQVVPGFLEVLDGHAERALPWLSRAYDLEPGNPITGVAYGQALVMAGQAERGCLVLTRISEHVPGSFFAGISLAFSLAVHGQRDDTVNALTPELLENARHDLQYSWTIAQCYAMISQLDDACDWVDNAVRAGFWNYPLLAERDPLLSPLHQDERYQALMQTTRAKWLSFRA